MNAGLQPSLWRTCRTLASKPRLRLLAELFHGGELGVSQVAIRCDMREPDTSLRLRQLQARGLVSARRQGRWTFYSPQANPDVRHAAEIVEALRPLRLTSAPCVAGVIRTLTAFTHPRRLNLLQAIAEGCSHPADLARRCELSRPALYRHLTKMVRRQVIQRQGDQYALAVPTDPLTLTLLPMAITPDQG